MKQKVFKVLKAWPGGVFQPFHLIYQNDDEPDAYGFVNGERHDVENPMRWSEFFELQMDLYAIQQDPEKRSVPDKVYCVPKTFEDIDLVHKLFIQEGWNEPGTAYAGELNTPHEMNKRFLRRWENGDNGDYAIYYENGELGYHHIRNVRDYGFCGPRVEIPVEVFCKMNVTS